MKDNAHKNRTLYPFLLTLLVIGGLAALEFLPRITIEEYELRKVSLFSDVIPAPVDSLTFQEDTLLVAEAEEVSDTLESSRPNAKIEVIAPPGVVAIEDFSFGTTDEITGHSHGMAHFYEALANRDNLGRAVRIAYYGDSFIEGDLMTSDLRAKLQTAYGGSGVGFVDIESPTAGFRASVRTYSRNWLSHSAVDRDGFSTSKQGIAERHFEPTGNSVVILRGVKQPALHQDSCQESTLFFRLDTPTTITGRINKEKGEHFRTQPADGIQSLTVSGPISEVTWYVPDSLSGEFYGATMDCPYGITLDNFSLRGSGGTTLKSIPEATLNDFARLREYDLVVFQFGLNVANGNVQDYSHYVEQMTEVIHKFAQAYPQTSILIVGMSDRGERQNGEVVTMPCVKHLNRYQRQLAMKTGTCYWNLFQAMGGEGSMGRLVDEEKPAKGNKDYTHINAHGGKFVAGLLFDAIQAGQQFYDEGREAK